jgi:hypothetical protein
MKLLPTRLGRMMTWAVALALLASWPWGHHREDPRTRDRSERADVIQVAPDVTGPVAHAVLRDGEPISAAQVLLVACQTDNTQALRRASLVAWASLLFVFNLVLRQGLIRLGVYRLDWRGILFDIALFVILWAAAATLATHVPALSAALR